MNADNTIKNPRKLMIEGEMTIFRAAELKPLLLSDPPLDEIDLSGITEIDTAGLQLLMLAWQTARREQRPLRLVAPSQAVAELFALLNVSAFFDEPTLTADRAQGAGRTSTPLAEGVSNES